MSYILLVLVFLIFVACVATTYSEGMWSNAISLINIVTAGLLAVNFYEPLARWVEGMNDWTKSCTYIWDFLSLWALFCLCMLIFRILTDSLSRVKVRFLKIADRIGGIILSALIGWVMICFFMMTLHTAPLSRNFLFEGFQPGENMVLGMAPDKNFLGFVNLVSKGVYARSELNEFDPQQHFIKTYETRRSNLEEHIKSTNSLRTK